VVRALHDPQFVILRADGDELAAFRANGRVQDRIFWKRGVSELRQRGRLGPKGKHKSPLLVVSMNQNCGKSRAIAAKSSLPYIDVLLSVPVTLIG
jgi:hypothetical protein